MPVAPTTRSTETSDAAAGGPASPTGSGRRERKVIETRRSILVAARQLFEADGYAETTVERIAEAADVAPRLDGEDRQAHLAQPVEQVQPRETGADHDDVRVEPGQPLRLYRALMRSAGVSM